MWRQPPEGQDPVSVRVRSSETPTRSLIAISRVVENGRADFERVRVRPSRKREMQLPRRKSSAVVLFSATVVFALVWACSPVGAESQTTAGSIRGVRFELSPAARCYEFEVPNRDGPDYRWLALDTVTVEAKHPGERDVRRLALRLGAGPDPYAPVSRTAWVPTPDSIEVLTEVAVPGYTLAETREGLVGEGWIVSDFRAEHTEWRTRLRRIPCGQLARDW